MVLIPSKMRMIVGSSIVLFSIVFLHYYELVLIIKIRSGLLELLAAIYNLLRGRVCRQSYFEKLVTRTLNALEI